MVEGPMKHSTHGSAGLSARRLRSGVTSIAAALMLATLVPTAAAADVIAVNEGETTVVAITLPYGGMTDVRYALRTEDGSAKAGVDYEVQGSHVVFPALTRTALVTVRVYPDEDSDSEHFTLVLSDLQTRKRGKWKRPDPAPGPRHSCPRARRCA